jgi:precorrin-2 methylase
MPLIRIVGLGPGDPDLLTLGSIEALRAVGRAVVALAKAWSSSAH